MTSVWVIKGSLGRSRYRIYRLVISVVISRNIVCLRSIPDYLVKIIESDRSILVHFLKNRLKAPIIAGCITNFPCYWNT